MTGGQGALTLDDKATAAGVVAAVTQAVRPVGTLVVLRATEEELQAHQTMLTLLDKKSGGKTVWRQFEPAPEAAAPVP